MIFPYKMNIKKITASLFLLVISEGTEAEDTYKFSNIPPSGREVAVLVLAPGMNADGRPFLKELEWTEFAWENNLGIIALNYFSSEVDLYGNSRGYYYPEQGSGKALLDEIKNIYKKDLPILLYGFSGGAQFISRFINWVPERIIAWCAYSAQFWDYPPSGMKMTEARGIVACGDLDAFRWKPSFDFYYQGRKDGLNWIWANISDTGHNRNNEFEQFVRNFFDEELKIYLGEKKPGTDIYANIFFTSGQTSKNVGSPELSCPFRTKKLLNIWKKIQAP